MTIPPWLTASAALSAIPAWIGLYITVRKHSGEKPILKFTLNATHVEADEDEPTRMSIDRKSTRLNSRHIGNSYAVFCLKQNQTIPERCSWEPSLNSSTTTTASCAPY